jgi:hypothetical protein
MNVYASRPRDTICALLGYYTAYSGNSSLTFRDNLSDPSSRVIKFQTLEEWTYRLSRNVGRSLFPGTVQISSAPPRKPEIRPGLEILDASYPLKPPDYVFRKETRWGMYEVKQQAPAFS